MDSVAAQLSVLLINEYEVNTKDSRNNTHNEKKKIKERERERERKRERKNRNLVGGYVFLFWNEISCSCNILYSRQ